MSLVFTMLVALPVLAQGDNVVLVDTGAANIRSGPAANTTVLGTMPGGTELIVTGRNLAGTWWLVKSPFGPGWISNELVAFRGSLDAVPIVDQPAGELAIPTVVVDAYPATVYRNPNADSFVLGIAPTGAEFDVMGLSYDGDWWQIHTPMGAGFVNVSEVAFRGDIKVVPGVGDPGPSFDGPTIRVNVETTVWTAPGGGESIGALPAGTALPASGRTADNSWWKVAGDFGLGWIPVSHVSLAGAASNIRLVSDVTNYGTTDASGAAVATIVIEAERKIAYYEPSFASAPMWDARLGEEGAVVARSMDGLWLQVTLRNYEGWMHFSGITLQGDMSSIPAIDTSPPPVRNVVIVNIHRLNIRTGPGVEYQDLGSVPGGTTLDVTGRHPQLPWLRVEDDIMGVGWVRIMYTIFRGNWDEVPLVTEPVGELKMPVAYIETPHNVYSQPNFAYPTGSVAPGLYTIVGRTADFGWAMIDSPLGNVWLRFDQFLLRGIAKSAPAVQ